MRRPITPRGLDQVAVHFRVGTISDAPNHETATVVIETVSYTAVPLLVTGNLLRDGDRVLVMFGANGEQVIVGKLGQVAGTLPTAPSASTDRSGYPNGVSYWTATTANDWPANGLLCVENFPNAGRTGQRLQVASTGSAAAPIIFARSWGSGPDWTPWSEWGSRLRTVSVEVTGSANQVVVTGTSFAETDTRARLSVVAPSSGLAKVTMGMRCTSDTPGGDMWMSCKVRNLTDDVELLDYDDNRVAKCVQVGSSNEQVNERSFLLTGMERGKTYQVRPGYRVEATTSGTWHTRWVIIEPSQ